MDDRAPDFEAALREVLAGSGAGGDEAHPTPENLVAYHHERLDAGETDAVQEHLARCRACGDLLLDLVEFSREPATATEPAVADLAEEAAWRRLAGRLRREESGSAVQGFPTGGSGPRRSRATAHLAYGLAAGFFAAAVGLGIWVAVLSGQLGAVRGPRMNLPIVSLEPAGFTRGDGETASVAAGRPAVVILNPPSFPTAASYGVEVLAADGRRLWSGTGLVPTDVGNFHLELPASLLAAGEIRIRLLHGGDEVATFSLRITP